MPSALIIEDELPNIERLEKMLLDSKWNIVVIKSLQTVKDAITWLRSNEQPDIIYMDIMLTDGLSFEIFNHVTITAPVIFITAYDDYALKAFEVNGVDYLLKPLEADKLEKSTSRALLLRGVGNQESLMELVKSMQVKKPIYRSRFLIAYRDRFVLLTVDEIAYFITENRVTFLITRDSRQFVTDQSLEMLEKELNPEAFFRVSRQIIVSLNAIGTIYQSFNGQVKIELVPAVHGPVTLSREKSGQLKKWLDHSNGY
jgi:two-component system, LytTR family, response regulator LytT